MYFSGGSLSKVLRSQLCCSHEYCSDLPSCLESSACIYNGGFKVGSGGGWWWWWLLVVDDECI